MPALKIILRNQPNSPATTTREVVRSFESETAEVISTQHLGTKRSVLYVLVTMLGLIMLYISIAHLDRLVPTVGRLVPIEGAITVQPLEKAMVTGILVAVGDNVKKGQVLATLDPTFAQADLDESVQKVASLDPKQRRIEAEEAGRAFHAESTRPYELLQADIHKQREAEFASGVRDYEQRISSTEAKIAGLKQSVADYTERLKLSAQQVDMYTQMLEVGVGTKVQLLTAQDNHKELERKMSGDTSDLDATEHTLESLKHQKEVYETKWHDDNLEELEKVKTDLDQAHDDRTKAKKKNELTNLVSPVDAVVLKVPAINLGGVVMDGEPMFSLIPVNAQVEVDAQIDAKDSGFVKVGDPVRIKFEAYKYLEHGIAEGVVRTISQDSFTQVPGQDAVTKESSLGESRPPFFDVRIKITALKLHDVPGDVRLVPGMPLAADIMVGRRTILWYLLGGALKSGAEAMREP